MPVNHSLEALSIAGDRLTLAFDWRGDRYGHELHGACGSDEFQLLARSREGLPVDAWPPSPAFQQLLVESRAEGRQVALLVGMSGTSHWSASVEPLDGEAGFLFDVACRVRSAPPQIGSEYTLEALASPGANRVGRFVIAAGMPAVSEAGRVIAPSAPTALPATIRWRYRLTLERDLKSRRRIYQIDGQNFTNLEGFYDEIAREFVAPGVVWGRNLDAFNDILRGRVETPYDCIELHWRNSQLSRERLGYPETVRQLERRLTSCHPTNRTLVAQELDDARHARGTTVFDWLVDIIRRHGPGGAEQQDGVELNLE